MYIVSHNTGPPCFWILNKILFTQCREWVKRKAIQTRCHERRYRWYYLYNIHSRKLKGQKPIALIILANGLLIRAYMLYLHLVDNVLSVNWCSCQDPKSGFMTYLCLQVGAFVGPMSSRKKKCCLRWLPLPFFNR